MCLDEGDWKPYLDTEPLGRHTQAVAACSLNELGADRQRDRVQLSRIHKRHAALEVVDGRGACRAQLARSLKQRECSQQRR